MEKNTKFGFGLMRLPKDEDGNIKQDKVNQMVDAFMAKGLTYFDTAYAYAGSEHAMKVALVDRYPRDSFTIADKLPAWKLTCQEDVKRIFDESLELSGVDFFDYYLLHSIEESHYPTYEKYNCFEFVSQMKKEGKIRNIGFSFHDSADFLDKVLTEHPEMDFVQLQLNYLDWDNGVIQSRKCYEVARKHNKPIVVMEPIKGGTLAAFPEDIEKLLKDYHPDQSIASWALRFIGSQPGIMMILSGMSTQEQMEDNLKTMTDFKELNEEEYALIDQVKAKVLSFPTIPCTACRYCTPGCPMNISIPDLFTAYNSQKTYGANRRYEKYYEQYTSGDFNPASACVGCGQCESVCPQHLPIIELLQKVADEFEK